jgi:hypothetical protein
MGGKGPLGDVIPGSIEARLTPLEEAFERWRKRSGLLLAPLAMLVVWWLPLEGLTPTSQRLLAVLAATVVLWMTEALPMGATALIGPSLAVVSGVAPAKEAFRSFADPIIFLFVGSFMLVQAMMRHGLNRRIAFGILALPGVGKSSGRAVHRVWSDCDVVVDVGIECGDDGDAVADRPGDRVGGGPVGNGADGAGAGVYVDAIGGGVDVVDCVWGVGWRVGDADRDAAEPDWDWVN